MAPQAELGIEPVAPPVPPAKQKSFFGIKYGKAAAQGPPAPGPADSMVMPQAPVAIEPVQPEHVATEPVQPYAPQPDDPAQQPAQVIQSAEAAAHANKQKSFFGIKYGKSAGAPKAAAAPAPAGKQKSFFGIKYGKAAAAPQEGPPAQDPQQAAYEQQFAPEYAQQAVAAPSPVAPDAYAPAAPVQQPIQAVPTAFPGGYPADFAQVGAQAPAAQVAAAPAQVPEQIMPPVAQTAAPQPAPVPPAPPVQQ